MITQLIFISYLLTFIVTVDLDYIVWIPIYYAMDSIIFIT